MKKIAFFQSDLGVGGIQKSLINLLSNIDYDEFEIDLYLSRKEKFWSQQFPEKLNIFYLKETPRYLSFIPFDLARRFISYDFCGREYDLAIDFNSYQFSCACGALSVPAKHRVMWVHNDVEVKLADEWKYRVLWTFFKGKFKHFDEFACVTSALIEPFKKMSGMKDKKYREINNFIDVSEIHRKMAEEPEDLTVDEKKINFVALGRLCHQKGYDIMLDAFAEACKKRDDICLYIIGDGEERASLEKQAADLDLEGKAVFLGSRSNPFACMKKMDAFISTSRYEGQGMNILEAMAVGLPLYCSPNLEKYIEGLKGCDNMAEAIAGAGKCEKKPDDLKGYNDRIMQSFRNLADVSEGM